MLFYFNTMLKLLFFMLKLCDGFYFDPYDILEDIDTENLRAAVTELDFTQTFFPPLEHYQVNAKAVTTMEHPWVAQVVHSRTTNWPHMCTATCIDKGIFITAARCINSLKVKYTSVVYKSKLLPVRSFVLPSKPTIQLFDDIGFIVIEMETETYNTIELINTKRTDEVFQWFNTSTYLNGKYKVIGYTTQKGIHKVKTPDKPFQLTELSVVIGMDLCPSLLIFRDIIKGYNVPCYHSCTVKESISKANVCKNYHGVEGGALIDINKKKLLGLATWGAYYSLLEMPVGFSIVNSNSFYEDFTCAKKVRNAPAATSRGRYQQFCN